jgi:hypothetical protein
MQTNIYNVSNSTQNMQTLNSLSRNNSNLNTIPLMSFSSERDIFKEEKLKIMKYLNTGENIQVREDVNKNGAYFEKLKKEEKEEEVYTSPLQETSYNNCKKLYYNLL